MLAPARQHPDLQPSDQQLVVQWQITLTLVSHPNNLILPVLNLEHYKHKKGYFRTKSHHTVPEYIILLVMGKLLEFISVKRQAGKQRNDAFNSAKYTGF